MEMELIFEAERNKFGYDANTGAVLVRLVGALIQNNATEGLDYFIKEYLQYDDVRYYTLRATTFVVLLILILVLHFIM